MHNVVLMDVVSGDLSTELCSVQMHPVLVCSKGCGVAEGHGLFLLFVDVANRMQNLFVFALLVISATLAADVVSVADGVDQQQKMLVCIVDRVDDSADETPVVSYGQQIAQMLANYMASRNFRGHPPKSGGINGQLRVQILRVWDGTAVKLSHQTESAHADHQGDQDQQMTTAAGC